MAHPNQILHNASTGQTIRFVRTGCETNGQLLEMEATFRAHSVEPVAHYHPHQTEAFTILSGELTVVMDGKMQTLKPGITLHIPKNTVHSMWNDSDAETVVNWQVRPALDTAEFFETVTGLVNDGKVTPKGMPPLLQTALMAQRFANVFRLAKPPHFIQKLVFGLLTPVAYAVGYRPTYQKYVDISVEPNKPTASRVASN
ncbi:cupin domain-containing protein [Fibrisoma limi BUZ 3]|uniref:Cupin domain-containing protein n=1 Tax=Fibrisoma limi BUZ 3 TaxID=1185876 RepID=I2GLF4_9BACT|nr:cupin domain-containing protein [Fibrisoma limi]CCH54730.1 cupin domain-containing protein [Fibrisoma limi BUZ 3]